MAWLRKALSLSLWTSTSRQGQGPPEGGGMQSPSTLPKVTVTCWSKHALFPSCT